MEKIIRNKGLNARTNENTGDIQQNAEGVNTQNTPLQITESTTLGELIAMLNPGEKLQETPTPKKLREMAGEPIAREERCQVYANGYAAYENESGRTVVWLPDCRAFTYAFVQPKESERHSFSPEKETLPEGLLETLPWAIPVTLAGDHRVEENIMNRTGSRTGTTDFDSADYGDQDGDAVNAIMNSFRMEYTWTDGWPGEDPLTACLRKERQEEMIRGMTEKQREVFLLYYDCGWNQREIGERLGLSRTAVMNHLKGAMKKVNRRL